MPPLYKHLKGGNLGPSYESRREKNAPLKPKIYNPYIKKPSTLPGYIEYPEQRMYENPVTLYQLERKKVVRRGRRKKGKGLGDNDHLRDVYGHPLAAPAPFEDDDDDEMSEDERTVVDDGGMEPVLYTPPRTSSIPEPGSYQTVETVRWEPGDPIPATPPRKIRFKIEDRRLGTFVGAERRYLPPDLSDRINSYLRQDDEVRDVVRDAEMEGIYDMSRGRREVNQANIHGFPQLSHSSGPSEPEVVYGEDYTPRNLGLWENFPARVQRTGPRGPGGRARPTRKPSDEERPRKKPRGGKIKKVG